jgi:hypothetical protein
LKAVSLGFAQAMRIDSDDVLFVDVLEQVRRVEQRVVRAHHGHKRKHEQHESIKHGRYVLPVFFDLEI